MKLIPRKQVAFIPSGPIEIFNLEVLAMAEGSNPDSPSLPSLILTSPNLASIALACGYSEIDGELDEGIQIRS